MVRVTIDEEPRKKLFAGDEPVELVDESGKPLGRVLPERSRKPPAWVAMTPTPTEEDLQASAAYNGPGMTTEELLGWLARER
ncbi:MAG: hypothetical protein AAF805_08100 [Planctomycetota bacterium]